MTAFYVIGISSLCYLMNFLSTIVRCSMRQSVRCPKTHLSKSGGKFLMRHTAFLPMAGTVISSRS
jgi:hypothetical protein